MDKSFGDASMVNNTGSITEEGPALSDLDEQHYCEDTDETDDAVTDTPEDVLIGDPDDASNAITSSSDIDSNILASTPDDRENDNGRDASAHISPLCTAMMAEDSKSDKPQEDRLDGERLAQTESTGKIESPGEEPEIKSPGEDPKIESTNEEPKIESPGEEPNINSPEKEPNIDSPGEEPKIESPGEEPNINSPKEEPNIDSPGEEGAVSTVPGSIYLDNDPVDKKQPQPVEERPKRLTMAQRAAMEALASFGGCDLSSVPVKKVDLRYELEADKKARKRQLEEEESHPPSSKKPKTRLEAARVESEEVFKGISLADGVRCYSAVEKMKASAGATEADIKVKGHITRVEKALKETLESFGGSELDSLPVKTSSVVKEELDGSAKPERYMSRVERARLETLQAFGGATLEEISKSKQLSNDKSENSSEKENLSSNTEMDVNN